MKIKFSLLATVIIGVMCAIAGISIILILVGSGIFVDATDTRTLEPGFRLSFMGLGFLLFFTMPFAIAAQIKEFVRDGAIRADKTELEKEQIKAKAKELFEEFINTKP